MIIIIITIIIIIIIIKNEQYALRTVTTNRLASSEATYTLYGVTASLGPVA